MTENVIYLYQSLTLKKDFLIDRKQQWYIIWFHQYVTLSFVKNTIYKGKEMKNS